MGTMRSKQAAERRGAERFKRWMWRFAAPVFAVWILVLAGLDIGPAWAAHLGHGTRGTFTATAVSCGKSCFYTGDFVSDGGSETRYDVGIDGSVHHVGQQVPALDTGDRVDVYPADGGSDWIYTSGMLLFSVGLLAIWAWLVPLAPLRRRRRDAAAVGARC